MGIGKPAYRARGRIARPNQALYTALRPAPPLGTAVKILVGVAIGIAVVIALALAFLMAALDFTIEFGGDAAQVDTDSEDVAEILGALPESVEFKRLYPDYMEDTISILPPHYQYELRAIDESGSVFETDSLIIEYNADNGEATSAYLCTEPDGDRVKYDRDDLAEAMAGVC